MDSTCCSEVCLKTHNFVQITIIIGCFFDRLSQYIAIRHKDLLSGDHAPICNAL